MRILEYWPQDGRRRITQLGLGIGQPNMRHVDLEDFTTRLHPDSLVCFDRDIARLIGELKCELAGCIWHMPGTGVVWDRDRTDPARWRWEFSGDRFGQGPSWFDSSI